MNALRAALLGLMFPTGAHCCDIAITNRTGLPVSVTVESLSHRKLSYPITILAGGSRTVELHVENCGAMMRLEVLTGGESHDVTSSPHSGPLPHHFID